MDLPPRPYAIAHRGAAAYAPENTLAAFRKAAMLGADMWEIDIRMTCDGQVIVFHDATLSDGRSVDAMTRAEIEVALPDCPLLEEVLSLAVEHSAGIYADIKDVTACLPTLEALRRHDIALAILGAFNTEAVQILRGADCPYPVAALVPLGEDPHVYAADADIVHLCWEHMDRPQDALTPALFSRAFANGQQIALWHEEDPVRMAEIRSKPVIGICSDMPELVAPFRPPAAWPVEVVCHRGANKIAPENTLPALECALAAGFSHIEVDLHVTADGEIVVMHDPTLDRTTNGTGPVTEKTLADLRLLDAGLWFDAHFAGTRLPTLAEVLALSKRYNGQVYLELKSAPPAPVWSQVTAHGLEKQCFFWSFSSTALHELRAIAPGAHIMARRQDFPDLHSAIETYDAHIIEFLPDADPNEIAALRGSPIKSMIAYRGRAAKVFDTLMARRPDMVNLDNPFDFRAHLMSKTRL
ncbi:glycerophosphodiester phosphodiesterase family protein [Gymnodinialimonas sp. 2305UL16-5]|uniref:glycerophosphodiester phosphodiesterase n=1 Tax=Gymnodinialimonas mytili TaxID=3126503 RepID=UPI0030A126E3